MQKAKLSSVCMLLLSVSLLSAAAYAEEPNTDGELTVTISGLRNHEGNVVVALYSDASAFPRDPSHAVSVQTIAADAAPTVVFKNLPRGDYAIALHHDENQDGKMSFNFLGMPKEGFGFSRNKAVLFGPPSFNSAKLEVKEPAVGCEVKVKYF